MITSTPIYHAQELFANVDALVAAARASGTLVVYVQHASDKVLPWGSDDWQLHPRLHPTDADLVVHKQHGDAFEATTLQDELAARGIHSLVITGLVTHGCVKATCLGARERGYAVVLVADGHSSYSKDAARLIGEWNTKLHTVGVAVMPAAMIAF